MKPLACAFLGFAVLGTWKPIGRAAQQPASAQQATPSAESLGQPEEGMVELNFGDDIELKGVVDYVSRRLGVNFLYDEQILNKKVSIRAPGKIPTSSLLGLLQSALKMKELALVDAEVAGWKRIVPATRLPVVARPGEAAKVIEEEGGATAVTQVFVLKHADPNQVDQSIKPFLSLPGANSLALKDPGVLIVTDYATNLLKIAKLVEVIDSAKPDVVVELLPLTHVQAQDLSKRLSEILAGRQRALDPTGIGALAAAGPAVTVGHDERTNQLVLIGSQKQVESVRDLVQALDAPLEAPTEIYQTTHVSAERLDRVVQDLVQPSASKRVFQSAVDNEANLLFVTTTPEIHKQISLLKEQLDVPNARTQSPIRFYKLQHVTAWQLLETLRAIEGEAAGPSAGRTSTGRAGTLTSSPNRLGTERSLRERQTTEHPELDRPSPGERLRGLRNLGQLGPNRPPPPPGEELPTPPAYHETPGRESRLTQPVQQTDESLRLLPGKARVTADEASNTLIVVADPAVQQVYAELIRTLDQRRPQVLIEAKLVVIDSSDDFTLGVEISGGDRTGVKRLFAFSSFGLSTVDPITGSLAIIPGTGFNGTLVNPEVADAVVRALSTHRRARILAAPRVLVNDNTEGVLASVAEVPFTSVNASQTVATTSFAGFADAGTTIVVRPHIGANDYLQLEFVVTMNNFLGEGTEGIPPARQTEQVESKITIPDGHTVIVGGLNRKEKSTTTEGIPFLDRVPVLRFLAGREMNTDRCASLFVFIRPIILRDDKFKDLKFLSDRDVNRAHLPGQFPTSEPLLIK